MFYYLFFLYYFFTISLSWSDIIIVGVEDTVMALMELLETDLED